MKLHAAGMIEPAWPTIMRASSVRPVMQGRNSTGLRCMFSDRNSADEVTRACCASRWAPRPVPTRPAYTGLLR